MNYIVTFSNTECLRISKPIDMAGLLRLVSNPVAFTTHQTKGFAINVNRVQVEQIDGDSRVIVFDLDLDDHGNEHDLKSGKVKGFRQLKVDHEELKLKCSRDADLYDQHVSRIEGELIKLELNSGDLRTNLLAGLNKLSAVVPNVELAGILRHTIEVTHGIADNTPIQCGHVMYKGECTSPLGILNGMFPDGKGIAMDTDANGDMFIPADVPVLQAPPVLPAVAVRRCSSHGCVCDAIHPGFFCKTHSGIPALNIPPAPPTDRDRVTKLLIETKPGSPFTITQLREKNWSDQQMIDEGYARFMVPPAGTLPAPAPLQSHVLSARVNLGICATDGCANDRMKYQNFCQGCLSKQTHTRVK